MANVHRPGLFPLGTPSLGDPVYTFGDETGKYCLKTPVTVAPDDETVFTDSIQSTVTDWVHGPSTALKLYPPSPSHGAVVALEHSRVPVGVSANKTLTLLRKPDTSSNSNPWKPAAELNAVGICSSSTVTECTGDRDTALHATTVNAIRNFFNGENSIGAPLIWTYEF